jgi:hypothetical protein
VRAYPNRTALMLAVEICSACYFVDDTMDTVIGNAICADGAAALLITSKPGKPGIKPTVLNCESYVASEHIDKVGFEHKDKKLRIILANEIRRLAGPLIERALDALLKRNRLNRTDVRFWIAHPGGRKVIDNLQKHLGLTDEQLRFSRAVMRNFGNMSSPTVMFVLEEVMRTGDPNPGIGAYKRRQRGRDALGDANRTERPLPCAAGPNSVGDRISARTPLAEGPGGSVRVADSNNFPAAKTIASALFSIKPGALPWFTSE